MAAAGGDGLLQLEVAALCQPMPEAARPCSGGDAFEKGDDRFALRNDVLLVFLAGIRRARGPLSLGQEWFAEVASSVAIVDIGHAKASIAFHAVAPAMICGSRAESLARRCARGLMPASLASGAGAFREALRPGNQCCGESPASRAARLKADSRLRQASWESMFQRLGSPVVVRWVGRSLEDARLQTARLAVEATALGYSALMAQVPPSGSKRSQGVMPACRLRLPSWTL